MSGPDKDDSAAHEPSRPLVLSHVRDLVWFANTDGQVEDVSRGMLNYLGKSLPELTGNGWALCVHTDDRDDALSLWSHNLAAGTAYSAVTRMLRHDGYRWLRTTVRPLRNSEGHVTGWVAVALDLEDPCAAEESFVTSERQLLELVETLPAMLTVSAPDGELEYANQRVQDFLGMPFAELKRLGWVELIHADDLQMVADVQKRSIESGAPLEICCRLRRLDGDARWVEMRVQPLFLEQRVVRWYGLLIDVDSRKKAEEALRQSEREQRLITETIPALVWRSTPEGMPDYINQRLMKYVGKTLAEFVREQLIHPDDVDKTLNSWDRARAEERPWEDTHRLLGADGQYRWFTSRGHPLRDETGRIVRWYGFNFDIDSSKKLEEVLKVTQARLSRASEIAAIAELAASIAHEINQPLASVVANGGACLGLLSAEPPDLERARRTAERVIRDGHAASEVIKRIRALFRQAPSTKVPLDLNEVVREVHELMMGEVLTSDIHMSVELASDLPRTLADRVQLQQVLVNLIRNALESMESVVDRSRALSIRTRCDALGSVTLEVCDAGPGLDTAQSIFEPFFTTKARGMGMGLAICRSIIEAHDGKIWARRNDTHGATFGFALPIHVSGPQPA